MANNWVETHREQWNVYQKNRAREYPEDNKTNFERWYKQNKDVHYQKRLVYNRANPERHRAQVYAWLMFPKAQTCVVNGCLELGERHHEDYSKPYEIRWLCHKHHKELSRK